MLTLRLNATCSFIVQVCHPLALASQSVVHGYPSDITMDSTSGATATFLADVMMAPASHEKRREVNSSSGIVDAEVERAKNRPLHALGHSLA